ncbi:unnamed protein product, partial [Penicillium nalgiovense]
VEYADLSNEGIHGNGHMFFMEKNNLEIRRPGVPVAEKALINA